MGHIIEGLLSHSEVLGFLSEIGSHLNRQMAHILMESHCLRFWDQGQRQGDQLGDCINYILTQMIAIWNQYGGMDGEVRSDQILIVF